MPTIILCSKPKHWCINSSTSFGLSFCLSSCSFSTRRCHPDCQYLTVPFVHSSLNKSNALSIVLHLMLTRHGMIYLVVYSVQHLFLSLRKKAHKLPICRNLFPIASISPMCLSSMTWLYAWTYDYSHCTFIANSSTKSYFLYPWATFHVPDCSICQRMS